MKSRILLWLAVLLSCLGFFIAVTLSLTEARGAIIPCGGSSGCATVADSPYSHFLGYPVAYFGVAGYLGLVLLTVWSSVSASALRWVALLAILGTVASGVLIAISLLQIHATCIWCLGSAITMAALFAVTLLRPRDPSKVLIWPIGAAAICLLSAALFGATKIASRATHNLVNQAVLDEMFFAELAPGSSPSRGTSGASVTIVEFADFACPACRDIEGHLRKLFSDTGGLRLVFRNLPQPFLAGHQASGYGALCGEIANEHGKFWPFAEQAFATPLPPTKADYDRILQSLSIDPPDAKRIADNSDPAVRSVNNDIALAHRLGLSVTPVFIVFSPELPPQVGTNVNLTDILGRPQIIHYLKHLAK